jgi:hypothetical protein
MKKSLITAMLSIMFLWGCDNLTEPVDNTKINNGGNDKKGANNEIQLEIPEYSTSLKALVDGNYVEVGGVSVYKLDNGYNINVSEYNECWKIQDINVWIGDNLEDLKAINANPAQFPDIQVESLGGGNFNIIYPFNPDWVCDKDLYVVVYASVKNECNCTESEAVAVTGEQILWAGKNINAGTVKYETDGDYLKLTYNLASDWQLDEAHLYVTENFNDVPKAKNGQPIPGKFTYHHTGSYYSDGCFTIQVSEITDACDIPLYVVAHAALTNLNNGTTETGFAGDKKFNSPRWAYYFSFDLPCGGGGSTGGTSCVFDAYGEGSSLKDNNIGDSWGWFFNFVYTCQ